MDVLIAGGGVAGLEALLGLHAVAGERVRLTLAAPDPDFTYRPMAVAEPFAVGQARRVPLASVVESAGAELVAESVVAVDLDARRVQLSGGGTRPFEALLMAPGARPVEGVPGATTWFPGGDAEVFGGLLSDVEQGYSKRLAIVVPPGAVWPLPAYELAIMTAGEASELGQDDVSITVVTPERAPLALFGDEVSAAVAEELSAAGVALRTGVVARRDGKVLVLEPGGERLEVQRVFAVPRLVGPAIEGLPADEEGFVLAGEDGLVEGASRVWAVGDGVRSPIKFGGLATHQARVAVAGIARAAGVPEVPEPGEPVLEGRLLLGSRRTRRLRGEGQGPPLWFPEGKIAGAYLPRWLAEHGFGGSAGAPAAPPAEGIPVRRPVREMTAEAKHLFDVGRRYRIADPEIASLGRAMRKLRSR
jgi:sulfide:quinone oxidoreductase